MSPQHWSKAREGTNREAIEYYQKRGQAPGVREGGAERNFYCMRCDGVIPHQPPSTQCPHCGEPLGEVVRRYFNWVEINEPPKSDLRALLPFFLLFAGLALLLVLWLIGAFG